MNPPNSKRIIEYFFRYGTLIFGVLLSDLWKKYYAQIIEEYGITPLIGYTIPFIIISLIIISPDIFRLGRGIYFLIIHNFHFVDIIKVIENTFVYQNKSLFYIDKEDSDLFQIINSNPWNTFYFSIKRILYNEYPVIYYNTTAKTFLNWIDYLYLKLLKDLQNKTGALVIIALHFDEEIYSEGYFTDLIKDKYQNLFEQSKAIIQNVVGKKVIILNEYWYFKKGSKGTRQFIDYFFGILIAKFNGLVQKVSEGRLTYNEFYRSETNLFSILSTIINAKKFRHLFVLDFKDSFQVWNQPPFSEYKRNNKIIFIKCNKITGPNGERLPAWSSTDGINLTDDTYLLNRKINNLNVIVLKSMVEILENKLSSHSLSEDQLRSILFEDISKLKIELNL